MSSTKALRPQTGGRVSLELVAAAPDAVVYRVAFYLPDDEWHVEARIDAGGAVTLEPTAAGPPAWLLDYARAFLRSEWRGRQIEDPPPWPDRLTRWRAG